MHDDESSFGCRGSIVVAIKRTPFSMMYIKDVERKHCQQHTILKAMHKEEGYMSYRQKKDLAM